MNKINKTQITLEKWQLDLLLEKITNLSSLLLVLKHSDLVRLDGGELEGVISSIYHLNESNYVYLNRVLGGEE